METAQLHAKPSIGWRLLKLPLHGMRFLLKHPGITLLFFLLVAFSSVSFLAHFNPAIATHFNKSVTYFGLATITSVASDTIRTLNDAVDLAKNGQARVQADLEMSKVRVLELESTSKKQGKAIKLQAEAISTQRNFIAKQKEALLSANHKLQVVDSKMNKFSKAGKQIETRIGKKFAKVAFLDAAGEVIGFIPIVGDVASVGLTAGGIYEMCQMFREIETATVELGAPFVVYTGTFCEQPAKKTIEVASEAAGGARSYLGDRVFNTQQYWANKLGEWL